jgi:hypothetical protein
MKIQYKLVKVVNILAALGGLIIACLPLYPRFAGSNVADNNRFLRTIKIRNTASFGGEAKPSVPRHKILRHVKKNLRV